MNGSCTWLGVQNFASLEYSLAANTLHLEAECTQCIIYDLDGDGMEAGFIKCFFRITL